MLMRKLPSLLLENPVAEGSVVGRVVDRDLSLGDLAGEPGEPGNAVILRSTMKRASIQQSSHRANPYFVSQSIDRGFRAREIAVDERSPSSGSGRKAWLQPRPGSGQRQIRFREVLTHTEQGHGGKLRCCIADAIAEVQRRRVSPFAVA
jgi:hypothetical protein